MTNEEFELRETNKAEKDRENERSRSKHSLAINILLIIAAICSLLFADGFFRLALLAAVFVIFMAIGW